MNKGLREGYTDDRAALSDEQLREKFCQHLNLMLGEKKWTETLGINSGIYTELSADELQKTLAYWRTPHEVVTKHFCISGNKTQILSYIKQANPRSFEIDDVTISLWG